MGQYVNARIGGSNGEGGLSFELHHVAAKFRYATINTVEAFAHEPHEIFRIHIAFLYCMLLVVRCGVW